MPLTRTRVRRVLPLVTPVLVIVVVLVVAATGLVSGQTTATPHVVLISIDGLKPVTYTAAGPSKVPTLRALARRGAWADGVTGVLPTYTYPSHTSIVTGVPPAVHGIYNNRVLDPEQIANSSFYWYARDIKVPTLASALKARDLTTAAVSWPVTVDADIDYLSPEFAAVTRHPMWLNLFRALAKPRHLLDTYENTLAKPLAWPWSDEVRTDLAAWIFKTYKPHLLMLHIFATDEAQHAYGPGSPEALAAIERADANVGRMLDAIASTDLKDRTDVVVVSDHGFLPIAQQLQLNFTFKQAGLIDVDGSGRITRWDAYFYPAGGTGFVILKNPDDAAVLQKVSALVRQVAAESANGVAAVLERDELRKMGADPRASLAVTMKEGFATGLQHDQLLAKTSERGAHGFAPSHPELRSSLIMAGPHVSQRGSLGVVRMTQIAPTLARWFDVALAAQADQPLPK